MARRIKDRQERERKLELVQEQVNEFVLSGDNADNIEGQRPCEAYKRKHEFTWIAEHLNQIRGSPSK